MIILSLLVFAVVYVTLSVMAYFWNVRMKTVARYLNMIFIYMYCTKHSRKKDMTCLASKLLPEFLGLSFKVGIPVRARFK